MKAKTLHKQNKEVNHVHHFHEITLKKMHILQVQNKMAIYKTIQLMLYMLMD